MYSGRGLSDAVRMLQAWRALRRAGCDRSEVSPSASAAGEGSGGGRSTYVPVPTAGDPLRTDYRCTITARRRLQGPTRGVSVG